MKPAQRPLDPSEKSYILEARIRDVPVSHVLSGLPGAPEDRNSHFTGWQPELNIYGDQVIIVGAKPH